MFRRTTVTAARSVYSVFMVQQKKNKLLTGLDIGKRGQALAKLYRALPKAELAKLKATAAKLPAYKKKSPAQKKAARKPRALTAYTKFVKANIKKQSGKTLVQKMKAVAKLWRAKKGGKKVSKK